MTESPKEEALRLAREVEFIDYTPTPGDSDYFNIDRWVRLIALARASQAQPEPPAGMATVPLEPLMSMSEAGSDAVGDEISGPSCHRIYVAMVKHWLSLSAAPSPITGGE